MDEAGDEEAASLYTLGEQCSVGTGRNLSESSPSNQIAVALLLVLYSAAVYRTVLRSSPAAYSLYFLAFFIDASQRTSIEP